MRQNQGDYTHMTDGIIVFVLQEPTAIELDWDRKEGFCFCFPCYTSFLMGSVLKQVVRFSVKFQKDCSKLNLQMRCFLYMYFHCYFVVRLHLNSLEKTAYPEIVVGNA